jgi:hypothetical protein
MRRLATGLRIALLFACSFLYLQNSLWIGYKISRDMDSGGPLAGLLVYPVPLGAATFVLFINRPRVRKGAGCGLLFYAALVGIAFMHLT